MTAAARFKQDDVARAIRGATAAGMRVGRVRIDPRGVIEIEAALPAGTRKASSWDDVLEAP
jgi:hypothetical protein